MRKPTYRHAKKKKKSTMGNVDISVISCTKNRTKDLVNFLDSLHNQTRLPDELIIVDASDNDNTKNMVQQTRGRLPFDVIYKGTAPGLTRQRNIGISLSRGNYLFFFDDDIILENEFIKLIY